jgi:ubiquinone/menaquinone biosynthesis C-methylase UbiE
MKPLFAWLVQPFSIAMMVLIAVALFFFAFTRGALLLRRFTQVGDHPESHIYPIYSNMHLIKLVDFQPIISAILLFQYPRLVSQLVAQIRQTDLRGKQVLITSCAFGNVIPRVVEAAIQAGAREVLVTDLVRNELTNAQSKLLIYGDRVKYLQDNAIALQLPDASVQVNVMFFLLHELPHPLKLQALREASRVLAPGGDLLIAEFHRPRVLLLRALSWLYFTVFETYGLALWGAYDPKLCLQKISSWQFKRQTCCFGNYQTLVATKTLIHP